MKAARWHWTRAYALDAAANACFGPIDRINARAAYDREVYRRTVAAESRF